MARTMVSWVWSDDDGVFEEVVDCRPFEAEALRARLMRLEDGGAIESVYVGPEQETPIAFAQFWKNLTSMVSISEEEQELGGPPALPEEPKGGEADAVSA